MSRRLKQVIRCSSCSMCARWRPAGFSANTYLVCTRFDIDVDGDDGCTMGCEGEPIVGARPYDVTIDHSMYTFWP